MNFPFGTNGKFIILGVPILKHISNNFVGSISQNDISVFFCLPFLLKLLNVKTKLHEIMAFRRKIHISLLFLTIGIHRQENFVTSFLNLFISENMNGAENEGFCTSRC